MNEMMQGWAVGHNMPGYLPEADVYYTTDHESAKLALIDEMERDCDSYDQVDEHDLANELSGAEQDLNLANGEWGTIVGNVSYWIHAIEMTTEEWENTNDC